MKIVTYTARTMQGAASMACQDGHMGEPLRRFWLAGQWHLTYAAKSRQLTLWQLRTERLRGWLSGFQRRATINTQRQIMRELRHG